MLREVTVPERVVTETMATEHRYWNTQISVAAIWVWCSRFRSVVGTLESMLLRQCSRDPSTGGGVLVHMDPKSGKEEAPVKDTAGNPLAPAADQTPPAVEKGRFTGFFFGDDLQ